MQEQPWWSTGHVSKVETLDLTGLVSWKSVIVEGKNYI